MSRHGFEAMNSRSCNTKTEAAPQSATLEAACDEGQQRFSQHSQLSEDFLYFGRIGRHNAEIYSQNYEQTIAGSRSDDDVYFGYQVDDPFGFMDGEPSSLWSQLPEHRESPYQSQESSEYFKEEVDFERNEYTDADDGVDAAAIVRLNEEYDSNAVSHSPDDWHNPEQSHALMQSWSARFWPPVPSADIGPIRRPRERPSARTARRIVPRGDRADKDFQVCCPWLTYPDLVAAGTISQGRLPLRIPGQDDVDQVEAFAFLYVRRLLEAFDITEEQEPPGFQTRTEAEISYFVQWQTESHNMIVSKLQSELVANPAYAEERVWAIVCLVVDMHRLGAPVIEEDTVSSKTDFTLKCSERLEAVINAMRSYTIVRLDVLRRARTDQLVADPAAFVKRKLTNVFVNQKKQAKSNSYALEPTNNTLGAKRDRRRTLLPKDECKEDEAAIDQKPTHLMDMIPVAVVMDRTATKASPSHKKRPRGSDTSIFKDEDNSDVPDLKPLPSRKLRRRN